MPASNPTSFGNKRVTTIQAAVLNNPWEGLIDGYNVFRLKDIRVNQYNALMLNITFSNTFVDSSMGDVSLGIIDGSSALTATGEPLKYIAGSMDWNLTPYSTSKNIYNFLWTNSDVNIDNMTPKFTGVAATYPEYVSVTQTDKTAVLPYIPNVVDIFFRQQPKANNVLFIYTLYGITNVT